jgi:CheY-like chemotaxis protein
MRSVRVLIGNTEEVLSDFIAAVIEDYVADRAKVEFVRHTHIEGIQGAASDERFDLLVLVVNNILSRSEAVMKSTESRIERVTEFIRANKARSKVPIVAFSGWNPPGLATRLEQAGADILLELPFKVEQLTELLDCCWQPH